MGPDQRSIVGFMGAAVVFALVGDVIKKKNGQSVPAGSYVKIILGGTLGAGLLSLLAEAGGSGAEFAKGLAVITMLASILVNGADVFKGVDTLTGSVNKIGTTTTTTAKAG
jgi:hypothetical protein